MMIEMSYYIETTEDGDVGIGSIGQDFLGSLDESLVPHFQ